MSAGKVGHLHLREDMGILLAVISKLDFKRSTLDVTQKDAKK